MTLQEELDSIYIRIGEGEPITEELHAQIKKLEDLLNPPYEIKCESASQEEGCGCGQPNYCWECAAIRGGCPEDV